jgi:hypothetical protein
MKIRPVAVELFPADGLPDMKLKESLFAILRKRLIK